MTLRPYQQKAHDAIINWVRKTSAPCLIEAATGAGKSHIIAAVAQTVHEMSQGKHVLCLAPSAELVIQNSEKYKATGNPFSLFSASAGQKSLRHPVVFGTPLTVINRIEKFGEQFSLVIIDECHGTTPTVKAIISSMREKNPRLRIVGMSATPYRMGEGYIFNQWADGEIVPQHQRLEDTYYEACVDRITARELIDMGYLTPPVIGSIRAESYHTLDMELNSRGQFDQADIDKAYHGQGRKTASIIADIVAQAQDRQGVMIFAATVRHANECMDSLPSGLSAIVTSDTTAADRKSIIERFKAREIKYLVNVSVLTTGFDAPHVDLIAMLRATESVGLMQQIIGRGLRLCDDKKDCLVLDYAENIDRHCPDDDIFMPVIESTVKMDGDYMACLCPLCNTENVFKARPNKERYNKDVHGYFVDMDGVQIATDFGPSPAHFGRRCQRKMIARGGVVEQCEYRWTSKECPHCEADNDIAARYCFECSGEIVDPNKKLRIEFKEMKRDPTRRQTDRVLNFEVNQTISRSEKPQYRINVTTEYRTFTYWVPIDPTWHKGQLQAKMLYDLNGAPPATITYQKNVDNKFYEIFAYNRKADEIPD
jgi:DNA repair protein RadD